MSAYVVRIMVDSCLLLRDIRRLDMKFAKVLPPLRFPSSNSNWLVLVGQGRYMPTDIITKYLLECCIQRHGEIRSQLYVYFPFFIPCSGIS